MLWEHVIVFSRNHPVDGSQKLVMSVTRPVALLRLLVLLTPARRSNMLSKLLQPWDSWGARTWRVHNTALAAMPLLCSASQCLTNHPMSTCRRW